MSEFDAPIEVEAVDAPAPAEVTPTEETVVEVAPVVRAFDPAVPESVENVWRVIPAQPESGLPAFPL